MKIERPSELRTHWNPNDPKQFFWIDDAFGAMQYDSDRSHEWNGVFPWLDTVLKRGAKVILTSRDYIYAHARSDLKQGAFPLLREAQVVVDVAELTPDEREQILYNHIRLGNQPRIWKEEFKRFFDLAAQHERFRPEIARRLGSRAFTKSLKLTNPSIASFIENPEAFLRESIEGLSDDDRSALAAIFIRGGTLESPVDFTEAELRIIARVGGTSRGLTSGLKALNGSFVRASTADARSWGFKHPTIGDAFASLVAEDPELVDLYISGAAMDKLLQEVTCGSVDMRGVKVVVPTSRFDMVIHRLNEFKESQKGTWQDRWSRKRQCNSFLTYRCSRDFLEQYIEHTPVFWDQVLHFTSYLSAVSEIGVLATLSKYHLLPESKRSEFVNNVKRLAVQTPDAGFLSTSWVWEGLLKENDIAEIMDHVLNELVPSIDDKLRSWDDNYAPDEDPNSYFSRLREALSKFRDFFGKDSDAWSELDRAIDEIPSLIEEAYSIYEGDPDRYDDDDDEREDRTSGVGPTPSHAGRPIYDDLDASG